MEAKPLANLLKSYRVNSGRTMSRIGRDLDFDVSLWSRFENGEKSPGRAMLPRIMDYFLLTASQRIELIEAWGLPIGLAPKVRHVVNLSDYAELSAVVARDYRSTARYPAFINLEKIQ